MRKIMLLAAMLAMVLAAAVPALAQTNSATATAGANVSQNAIGVQFGEDNVQCVQNATQEQTNVNISQYSGDITQVNFGVIAQECNISVVEAEKIAKKLFFVKKTATATAHAKKSPAAVLQYKKTVTPTATATALPPTGGVVPNSALALGAGALLVAGGLLARRIVR